MPPSVLWMNEAARPPNRSRELPAAVKSSPALGVNNLASPGVANNFAVHRARCVGCVRKKHKNCFPILMLEFHTDGIGLLLRSRSHYSYVRTDASGFDLSGLGLFF